MSAALLLVVLLPAVGGTALLLGRHRLDGVAAPLALGLGLVGAALAIVAATGRPTVSVSFLGSGAAAVADGADLALAVDGLSAVLTVTVAVVALTVTVHAAVDHEARTSRARFFGYWLLFVAAMQLTVTATTFPALMLGWEVMGATSYALIGFRWRLAGRTSAGTTALLTTRAADLGLYVAAGAVLAGSGSLGLSGLEGLPAPWAAVATTGVVVAALGKSAQLPLSGWLSAAMQGPSPVSALLHSATMVAAGGYLLLRLGPALADGAAPVVAWVGAATALALGLVAVAQTDLKQLLAASTAAQMGFVVLAAGAWAAGAGTGLLGGVEHLVAHAAVKAGLFVAAGIWLGALGTRALAELRGAGRRYPLVGAASVAAAAALAGVPPLSLWVTKDEILAGAEEAHLAGGAVLHVVALVAGALSAAYAAKIVAVVLAPRHPGDGSRAPRPAVAAALALAAAAVGLGAFALPVVRDGAARVLGAQPGPAPTPGALVLSGGLAVVVAAVVLWRPALVRVAERAPLTSWWAMPALLVTVGRGVRALARRVDRVDGGLDRSVHAVARAVPRLAGRVAVLDDSGIHRAVRRTAGLAVAGARRAAVLDDRRVDGAVRDVASGVARAGHAARRLQTGLLHQYYAQAAAGLGLLLLLLLLVR
ncbi:proton-conducting transporter membrane subunit [Isoptericola sp. 178]|uniref:proton-conducting transporter transmembrane domain-containing protein n=1 Tax=Isoptericola sp. 178 TaxID=3064651 RepID=UPI0027123236|nr:proton-conducting transporter membrane subunit [Isoptericola sp. 178]MDO8144876.1 proton-conducting transporter membrane subunit [Isoptericola sp. 178]